MGEGVRGGMAPRKPTEHSCWRGLKGGRWSDKVLERFTAAIEQARREGFSGPQALNRARSILWPQPTSSLIDTAIHDDDVEFIESVYWKHLKQAIRFIPLASAITPRGKKSLISPANYSWWHRG
jgi:hypothetical protein